MENKTYFISKRECIGYCCYEFQPGKYKPARKLEDSLCLSAYQMGEMSPFGFFIDNFDYLGVTCLNKDDCNAFIEKLRIFASLLKADKGVLEALEHMELYNPRVDGSWSFEDKMNSLNIEKLYNTTEALSEWIAEKLKTYKVISIIGI